MLLLLCSELLLQVDINSTEDEKIAKWQKDQEAACAADVDNAAAAEEPSAELKEAAAQVVGMVRQGAHWPPGLRQWLVELVEKGRTDGLPKLCEAMSQSEDVPALKGKGAEVREALCRVLLNSEIWAAVELAFPEAAPQKAATEKAVLKAPETLPKLQQACKEGNFAAVKELLQTEEADINWTNQASINYVYLSSTHYCFDSVSLLL